MAVYPLYTTIQYQNPLVIEYETKTMISQFEGLGKEQRKKKLLYPRRNITVAYRGLTRANAAIISQFYTDRGGTFQAFNFFLSHPGSVNDVYSDEYVGTGDGATLVFNLPSKNASSYTVKKNGVIQSGGGVDYTFSATGGADSADKITFVTAPADGDRILLSFTGMLKIHSRFMEDRLPLETLYDRLTSIGVKLKGLLNE